MTEMFIQGITHKHKFPLRKQSPGIEQDVRNGEGECTKDVTILLKISGTTAHWKYCAFVLFHPREVFYGKKESGLYPGMSSLFSKKDENMMNELSL